MGEKGGARVRRALLMWAVAACVVAITTSAYAAGGSTIAGAPAAVEGRWQRGDLGSAELGTCWKDQQPAEFWRLRVRAGDRVKIEWYTSVGDVSLMVYRRNVNDYNLGSQSDGYATDQRFANRRRGGYGHVSFTAPASGRMPIEVCSYNGEYLGPVRFRVKIRH